MHKKLFYVKAIRSEHVHVFFFEKNQKCSYGYVEFFFDNPDKIFLTESPEIFRSKCENNYKFMFLRNMFPPKCFSGHVECSFNNSAGNFLPKSRKFFIRCRINLSIVGDRIFKLL